jgi:hypothetical protein
VKADEETLVAEALHEHVGKRAQRGRMLDTRIKSPRL